MLNKTTLFALTLALASIAPLASAAAEGGCCGDKCCCKGGDCCAGAKSTSVAVIREEPIRESTAEAQRWDGTTKPTAQQFNRR